jgi:nucleotide-binding universal stress UspA family protein
MAVRDLLVYVDQTEAALVRLRLAADLAGLHSSRLTALFVRQRTPKQLDDVGAAELGLASADAIVEVNRRIEASIDAAADRLRAALETLTSEHGLTTEWCCVNGLASVVVPQHARYADFCILGHERAAEDTFGEYRFSEEMLFGTGRPLVFIPSVGSSETLGRHIAVAWNSSRPAARAVNDALPLIERADRTTVLLVNPRDYFDRYGAPPGERMVEHLIRHGANAEAVRIDNVPEAAIADALQTSARALGADLLVAGAFGHAALWEKLFGGVTRELLDHLTLPLMMSH